MDPVHITKCPYAKELLERYKNYKGRIGASCDFCNDKNCIHNAIHLKINGFEKEYAFNILESHMPDRLNVGHGEK